jgi:adenine nucleotide transporter 17
MPHQHQQSTVAVAITYPLTTLSTWQALERGGRKDKDEGAMRDVRWGSLFSGIGPTLTATAISQAVYFWIYSKLRHAVASALLLGDGGRLADIGVLGSTVVASLAGCGNVLITTPAWVIATQMIAKEKSPVKAEREMDLKQVARKIHSEGGLVGLWRGLVPSLVMVLNPTIQFVLYERLVARLLALRGGGKGSKNTLGAGDIFLLTAVAKLGSTLVTYPLLLIKSRLQAASKSDSGTQYTGVLHDQSTIDCRPFQHPLHRCYPSSPDDSQRRGVPRTVQRAADEDRSDHSHCGTADGD